MSRRLSALTIAAVVSLLAAGVSIPLVPGAAAQPPAYGSRVFQANPYVVPDAQSYPIYAGSTVAQSFLVNESYYLENVTLRVLNGGNKVNALNVSIHPDDPVTHVPLMATTLASFAEVTPNNTTTPVNWSWPFNPAPLLLAGRTYWIVAQNGAQQAINGYEWFSTNGTTYPDGEALLGSPSWAGLPDDMFFITFGQGYDANVTPAMDVNHANAQPDDFVTFTVRFNNTGAQTSPRVWINDTLPACLLNTSLSFPGLQPVSAAAFPNLVFTNVTNGPHFFTLTAQIAIGTLPGSLVTNAASLAFANATDVVVQAGSASASVRVGLVTKQLYLAGTSGSPQLLTTTAPVASVPQTTALLPGGPAAEFALSPALATPLHGLNVTATLWLSSQLPPTQTYHLTLGLTDNATTVTSLSPSFLITTAGFQPVRFTFPLSGHTFGRGHVVGLQITNLGGPSGSTDTLVVGYNATSQPSRLDVLTDTYVAIAPLVLGNEAGPTALWSSLDSLIVEANVSDPFGESRIKGVWVNLTTPSGHLAASGAMTPVQVDASSLPAWELVRVTLAPPLELGTYRVVVNAMEDNGVAALAEAWAPVQMPTFAFAAAASKERVENGNPVALFLWYNNTGNGRAGWAWINDTLPSGLTFIGSSLAVTSVNGSTFTWSLTNVSVGVHSLEVDVLVTGTSVDWVRNAATLSCQDTSHHPLPTLYANTSLFLNGPIIAISVASSPSGLVHGNETVTYTFTIANTGEEAGQIWLNDTLPTDFAYGGSSVSLLGGTVSLAGPYVNFSLPSLPANTTWHLDLVAVAGPGLARGTAYWNNATATYTTLNGLLMPPAEDDLALTAAAPSFSWPSVSFLGWEALPGSTIPALVTLDNVGNEPANDTWVTLTVDPRLSLDDASVAPIMGSGTISFDLGTVGLGSTTVFLNFTVNTSAPDRGALNIVGSLTSRDGFGNPLPPQSLVPALVFVHAARVTLVATPASPLFEAGTPYPLTLTWYNWGSDVASNIWVNLTMPSSLVYMNDTYGIPPTVSASDYSWHRTNLSPGSFSMQLWVEPRPSVLNGTPVSLRFSVDYQGSNLAAMPPQNATVNGVILAPDLVLTIDASATQVTPPGSIVYRLRVTNVGKTTAESVYLVDTLDPRLQDPIYDANVTASVQNQTYNWTFSDLAPGQSIAVNLTVKIPVGTAAGSLVPNAFEVTYTNSIGVVLATRRSPSYTVGVNQDLIPFVLGGLAAVAAAGAVLIVVRRRKVEIEEVFLVYRDGVLISHLSRTLLREKDEDVLSGMLTAVQEFVREAFQYGEHRDLHQMDFGDYRILIERGKYVFLAIVYSGRESMAIHKKVRAVIARVEREFGTALENWDGDMEPVMGARDVIRDTLLGSGNHNHAPKPAAEPESE